MWWCTWKKHVETRMELGFERKTKGPSAGRHPSLFWKSGQVLWLCGAASWCVELSVELSKGCIHEHESENFMYRKKMSWAGCALDTWDGRRTHGLGMERSKGTGPVSGWHGCENGSNENMVVRRKYLEFFSSYPSNPSLFLNLNHPSPSLLFLLLVPHLKHTKTSYLHSPTKRLQYLYF